MTEPRYYFCSQKSMKSIVLALALGVASADYLKSALFYSNHGACDGTPAFISSAIIDCETNGDFSSSCPF